jgi:hypothetical protein
MNLLHIIKLANKFNYLVSQIVNQQDVGNAERQVLVGSGVVSKIQGVIKQYFAKQNIEVVACSIKITLAVETNDKGIATSANTTQFEPYCSSVDVSFNYNDLSEMLLNQFGKTVATLMLKAYQTNAACKNVLKQQFDSNPSQQQVVMISV